jgi:hypothetical protein
MNKSITFLRWSVIVVVIAVVGVYFFRPHYLGITEYPDIKKMTSEVLISGKSFKDQKSKELLSKYGCNFWQYQEQALNLELKAAEFLIQNNMEAKEIAAEFIKNYEEMKSEIESKHLADKKTGDYKILTTKRQLEIRSLEKNLEKYKNELVTLPQLLKNLIEGKNKLEVDKEIVISMSSQCTNQPK